jgi:PmbA protein
MMRFYDFASKTIDYSKKCGFSESELNYTKSYSNSLVFSQKKLSNCKVSNSVKIIFRGIFNGKMGYSYTEILDEKSIKVLVDKAKENIQLIDSDESEFIYGNQCNYKKINSYDEKINEIKFNKKRKIVLELEDEILKSDERIESVVQSIYGEEYIENMIVNSKGINLNFKSNILFLYLCVVGKNKNEKIEVSNYVYIKNFKDIKNNILVKKIVNEIASRLKQFKIKSQNYKVVLESHAASKLLKNFIGIFNSDNVQKGFSKLKNMEGKKIASKIVNIVDDPHLKYGLSSIPFDSEAVPTKKKYIVKNGILNTLLYNLKTAQKAGVVSTGNASMSNCTSCMSISPTNCFIERGNKSVNDILKYIDEGIILTDLLGLNSGINVINGEFSLATRGYYFRNGEILYSIVHSTISGNFYDLLNNIKVVANDLNFNLSIASPSLYIGNLFISSNN